MQLNFAKLVKIKALVTSDPTILRILVLHKGMKPNGGGEGRGRSNEPHPTHLPNIPLDSLM